MGCGGDGIPLGARIVVLADAWDAMTSDRPYRRALPFDAARREVRENSGTQFDPGAVEALERLLECGDTGWRARTAAA